MSWTGANFIRALGSSQWQNDAAANIGIQAGIHDTQDNDLATGIDNCINKNGANTPTANLSMGGFAHTNVAAATIRTQYAQVAQVQTGTYNFATTGGSANAQTLTLAPALTAHTLGTTVWFRAGFTNTTSNPTLNVNGLGALQILRPDTGGLYAGDITSGLIYNATVVDGTFWILNNPSPVSKLGSWQGNPVTGTRAAEQMYFAPSSLTVSSLYMPRAGRATGISHALASGSTITAGDFTILLYKNGVYTASFAGPYTSGSGAYATITAITFSSGDYLDLRFNSNGLTMSSGSAALVELWGTIA